MEGRFMYYLWRVAGLCIVNVFVLIPVVVLALLVECTLNIPIPLLQLSKIFIAVSIPFSVFYVCIVYQYDKWISRRGNRA
jgi:membrane protein implicated in regulation of membrane protease activity